MMLHYSCAMKHHHFFWMNFEKKKKIVLCSITPWKGREKEGGRRKRSLSLIVRIDIKLNYYLS
jgi:hypothetical protein